MNTNNLFHQISPGPKPPKEVHCLVEIPKGTSNKYEYDKELDVFKLDRVLYSAIFYPTEYGIIPRTWSEEDSDPLDIMVVSSFSTFPGCLLTARPIGLLRMIDCSVQDNKIIAVPSHDPRFNTINDLPDLAPHYKLEISNFFENYAWLQPDKKIKVEGWSNRVAAWERINFCIKAYQKIFS
jgi:inorganic pyrophosphatase